MVGAGDVVVGASRGAVVAGEVVVVVGASLTVGVVVNGTRSVGVGTVGWRRCATGGVVVGTVGIGAVVIGGVVIGGVGVGGAVVGGAVVVGVVVVGAVGEVVGPVVEGAVVVEVPAVGTVGAVVVDVELVADVGPVLGFGLVERSDAGYRGAAPAVGETSNASVPAPVAARLTMAARPAARRHRGLLGRSLVEPSEFVVADISNPTG